MIIDTNRTMSDWVEYKLEECCEILDRLRVPLNAEVRERISGNVPYYGANGIQGFIDKYLFDENLILIAEDGGNFEQFATRPIAYQISGKSWVNNHAHVLRAKKGFNQDAIFYSLLNKNILPFIVGGTRSKLNQAELRSITIKLPKDESEQTCIAEILSCVDRSIEQTKTLIAKQQRIQAGLMQDLLTKGIDEHGNVRLDVLHGFKDSPLGRIPKAWEVYTLEQLTTKIVDGVHKKPEYVEFGVPFITISDLTTMDEIDFSSVRYITEKDHNEFKRRADPRAGDVLVTKDGTLGVARIVPEGGPEFSIFVSVAQLRPNRHLCLPELIWAFFDSGNFEVQLGALSAGTGLKHIHLEHFRRFRIAVPRIEEQQRIFCALNAHAEYLRCETVRLEKLKRAKQGLMQDLLKGKTSVQPLLN
jgi:type I restriction enzyme, S subunit